ncbi:C-type lectin domain family 2 member D11-like [Sigmodon hispidus]
MQDIQLLYFFCLPVPETKHLYYKMSAVEIAEDSVEMLCTKDSLQWEEMVRKTEVVSITNTYAACPRDWIGFGSKCFYFSENTSNWTYSQTLCKEQGAQLARFDSIEELNFLKRCKGTSDYWINLHRESPEHPWRWTNNTEYNSLVSIRGNGERAFLSNNGISSGRGYVNRRWICYKSNSYTLQCKKPFSSS